MKKLTVEEAKDLVVAKTGRTTKISAMTEALKVGEAIIISPSDWNSKKPPYTIINRVAKKTGRVFEKGRLPDGSGWGVKRIS